MGASLPAMTPACLICLSLWFRAILADKYSERVIVGNQVELDSPLHDIRWRGPGKGSVLVRTQKGHLWRSLDEGKTWSDITHTLPAEDNQRAVEWMQPSPADDNVLVVFGLGYNCWITEDAGVSWRRLALDAGTTSRGSFQFHKLNRNWALASHWTAACQTSLRMERASQEEGEVCSHVLYLTKDLGRTFTKVATHVVQFGWGAHQHVQDSRIYFTAFRDKTMGQPRLTHWMNGVDFGYTDDFGRTVSVLVGNGNKFQVAGKFLLIVKVEDMAKQHVNLMVSSDGGLRFHKAILPHEMQERSYVLLDTSEGAVVLHVNHGKEAGDVYVSDGDGVYFGLSLPSNVRSQGICAFEKLWNLDGIYLANVQAEGSSKVHQPEDEDVAEIEDASVGTQADDMLLARYLSEEEYGHEPMQSPGMRRLRQLRLGRAGRRLAQDSGVAVRTVISFDTGGEWQYVRAPEKDSKGSPVTCAAQRLHHTGCNLNLHDFADVDRFAPFYSYTNAVGIVMGSGNVGDKLTFDQREANTYLSRDGGLTWAEARKGVYIYEFGNHGGLLVMADMVHETDTLVFSWNEGATWHEKKFTNTPMHVENVIIEPEAKATKFVLYGVRDGVGIIQHIDMSEVHRTVCRRPDLAGQPDSDYELWSPSDGFGSGKLNCLMGQDITYVRRRAEVECFNDLNMTHPKPKPQKIACPCTAESFECGVGFHRPIGSFKCVPDGAYGFDVHPWCRPGDEFVMVSTHRKVAGDVCVGGWQPPKERFDCPKRSHWGVMQAVVGIGALLAGVVLFAHCASSPEMLRDYLERFGMNAKATRVPRWAKPDFRGSGGGRYRAPQDMQQQQAPDAEMVGLGGDAIGAPAGVADTSEANSPRRF